MASSTTTSRRTSRGSIKQLAFTDLFLKHITEGQFAVPLELVDAWVNKDVIIATLKTWKQKELEDPVTFAQHEKIMHPGPKQWRDHAPRTIHWILKVGNHSKPEVAEKNGRWHAYVTNLVFAAPLPGDDLSGSTNNIEMKYLTAYGLLLTALDDLQTNHEGFFQKKLGGSIVARFKSPADSLPPNLDCPVQRKDTEERDLYASGVTGGLSHNGYEMPNDKDTKSSSGNSKVNDGTMGALEKVHGNNGDELSNNVLGQQTKADSLYGTDIDDATEPTADLSSPGESGGEGKTKKPRKKKTRRTNASSREWDDGAAQPPKKRSKPSSHEGDHAITTSESADLAPLSDVGATTPSRSALKTTTLKSDTSGLNSSNLSSSQTTDSKTGATDSSKKTVHLSLGEDEELIVSPSDPVDTNTESVDTTIPANNTGSSLRTTGEADAVSTTTTADLSNSTDQSAELARLTNANVYLELRNSRQADQARHYLQRLKNASTAFTKLNKKITGMENKMKGLQGMLKARDEECIEWEDILGASLAQAKANGV